VVLGQQGKLNESIEKFEQAIKIDPNNADAYYN
jgi:tetratricopeptide (TPR) repeat protein